MKYIELIETQTFPDATTPAGIYLFNGGTLVICSGNALYPTSQPVGGIKIHEKLESQEKQIGINDVMKLIAVGTDVELAKKFAQ